MILTSHHTIDGTGRWSDEVEPRSVKIGDRTWVGARAPILSGARIDANLVVADGAVATGHPESLGVDAGVPARRIRDYRDQGPASHAPDGGRAR